MEDYDLILVGSPVWCGAPATPVHTFLKGVQGYQGGVATFYTDAGSAGDYEKNLNNGLATSTLLVFMKVVLILNNGLNKFCNFH